MIFCVDCMIENEFPDNEKKAEFIFRGMSVCEVHFKKRVDGEDVRR